MPRTLPTRVKLRCELRKISLDPSEWKGETERYEPYIYHPDPEMEEIIAQANGNPDEALRLWYARVRPRLLNERGVLLIAGRLQDMLHLPIRQLYIDKEIDAVCRVDPEPDNRRYGRVTQRLL